MKRTWVFLLRHSHAVMMSGFAIAVAGLLFFMYFRHTGGLPRSASYYCTFAGFGLYITGRVLGVVNRRAQKRSGAVESNGRHT